jgi:hypothetical protein
LWRKLIAQITPNKVTGATEILLEQMVRHLSYASEIGELLAGFNPTVDKVRHYHLLLTMQHRETCAISRLATALKLRSPIPRQLESKPWGNPRANQ